ncbi:hypothetical protein JOF28_002234 [Leucobacter exalbidus]|uniref:Uncharacterized protein n=1 Tax=Leucobacter exalbidus TaxID=662960 RepID=A0A940T495_9MICO|nr:hypothetical protein [Leucobacter exalbidus]
MVSNDPVPEFFSRYRVVCCLQGAAKQAGERVTLELFGTIEV